MEEKNFDVEIEAEEKKEEPAEKSLKDEIIEWVQAIVIAVVLALLIRSFVFTVVRVDGQSMEPTYQHNDRLIVWRLGYEPEGGDIIVFNPPGKEKNVFWIKRVIATEGQHVEIDYDTNSVFVDGEKIDEPYLGEPMMDKSAYLPITELDIPEDCVFVLGDNRNNSSDGRLIGPVNEENIIGKAVLRFWPFSKIETY